MRAPIACAFAWPQRLDWPAPKLDLAAIGSLTFETPDADRFPAIGLAREAMRLGQGGPTALNGANEAAVAAFLDHRIGFLDIARACEDALSYLDRAGELAAGPGDDAIETALRIDARARAVTADLVGALKAPLAAGN